MMHLPSCTMLGGIDENVAHTRNWRRRKWLATGNDALLSGPSAAGADLQVIP